MDLRLIAELSLAQRRIIVDCGRCTKQGFFVGATRSATIVALRKAGWRMVSGKEICPKCLNEPRFTNDLIHNIATAVTNQANR